MTAKLHRSSSKVILFERGLAVPDHLPLLDDATPRSTAEIIRRLLCLHVCAAVSYGFSTAKARDWAVRENVADSFEEAEIQFLGGHHDRSQFQYQIEGMFVLHWVLGLEQSPNWFDYVDDGFVLRLPDLKAGKSADGWRASVDRKSSEEIMQLADLSFCLHWIAREGKLAPSANGLPFDYYVAEERRRAVDWVIGSVPWYSISLDT